MDCIINITCLVGNVTWNSQPRVALFSRFKFCKNIDSIFNDITLVNKMTVLANSKSSSLYTYLHGSWENLQFFIIVHSKYMYSLKRL